MNVFRRHSDSIGIGLLCGLALGGAFIFFARGSQWLPYVVATAGAIGFAAGWKYASHRRIAKSLEWINSYGGTEGFLDHIGREYVTVTMPQDHPPTEAECAAASEMGRRLTQQMSVKVYFHGLERRVDSVGMVFLGRRASRILEELTPHLREVCPPGTYCECWHLENFFPRTRTPLFDKIA